MDDLPLETYKQYSALFDTDLYDEIALETCVNKRTSLGGTCVESVKSQIAYVKSKV